MKIVNVVGARPNYMKVAPIVDEMKKYPDLQSLLVHTGQHYDPNMSKLFFEDLGMPQADIFLGVGSASHAQQTARVMVEFEKILLEHQPDLVLVVGDVNSTLACTLTAVKLNVKVAHVEAGLRSRDRTMPEEINRIVTDAIADLLFTTERDAVDNLIREGVCPDRIFFVGNVMIDSLLKHREKAALSPILEKLGLTARHYGVLTLHRPGNVDNREVFGAILEALQQISEQIPLVYPAHPRTLKMIKEFGFDRKFPWLVGDPGQKRRCIMLEPQGYLDFLKLTAEARIVLTDSGGIQEETTVLGVPCLTIRENTERPITVTQGTNTLVGTEKENIIRHALRILSEDAGAVRSPELWDGKASQRIVEILRKQ